MNLLSRGLAVIALLVVGCAPASAGCLLLMKIGKCSASGPVPITTPTNTPQPSALFTQSSWADVNVGLKTTTGEFNLPSSDAQASFWIYNETLPYPFPSQFAWLLGLGNASTGLFVSSSSAPILSVQVLSPFISGHATGNWWLPIGANTAITAGGGLSVTKPTNAALGYYAWAGDTSGAKAACPSANGAGARPPQGFLNQTVGSAGTADPGMLCGATPTGTGQGATVGNIAGLGMAQTAGATITSCTSNSPVSGEFSITLTTAIAHGLEQGTSFALNSSATTGFNTNYAITAAGSTTLTGFSASTGTCPASTGTATIGAGTSGAVTYGLPATNPFVQDETTGIQLSPNQRACILIGENGDDTSFPGAQVAKATKIDGTDLPGSPFVSPWLNMGAVSFTGYTNSATQPTTSPALTVTAMASYTVTAASLDVSDPLADVSFTISTGNPLVLGSEFTVTGTTGFDGTYIAVSPTPANTQGTGIKAKLLSGPVGVPTPFVGSPGAWTGTASAVGVIMPGMQLLGASSYAQIGPFGQYGGTGTGGIGTYSMTTTQAALAVTGSITTGGVLTISANPLATQMLTVGTQINATAPSTYTGVITGIISGTTGGIGTYQVSPNPGAAISSTLTAGPLGNGSGTPVNIYAANGFYYTLANTTTGSLPGGNVTTRTASSIGDFFNIIGSDTVTSTGAKGFGIGGAIGNVGMYQGVFPATNGTPTTAAFNSLCQKSADFQDFATTNGGKWSALHRLNDPGIWADSSVASIQGYISGASGTTGTLNVSSTQHGALTGSGTVTIAGPGIPGCPQACPTAPRGAGPTYALTWASSIAANVGSVGSPFAMTAGNSKPAIPTPSIPFTGSIATGAQSVLSVTNVSPASPWTANTAAIDSTGLNLTFTSLGTGTLFANQCIIDSMGVISPSAPLCVGTPGSGTTTIQANYFPAGFTFNTADVLYAYQTRIVSGQYVTDTAAITTPVQVTGQLTQVACASGPPVPATVFGECGTYALSASPNASGSVSSEQMFMSGIGASGAIAPGPALTIDNPGMGTVYPLVVASSPLVGTMQIAGTYDVATLGGTPSFIQAQISATPGGPALSGCSACAWTNLSSASVAGGKWSGSVVNIPGGTPYYLSVRAANGMAYATLPTPVGVGINIATFGQGNTGWLFNNDKTVSFFSGLGQAVGYTPGNQTSAAAGVSYGPPVVNNLNVSAPTQVSLDAYGQTNIGEGSGAIIQNASAVLAAAGINVPVSMNAWSRNGVPFQNQWWDNLPQTQTIGIGNGTSTVFSSGAGFGGTVGGNMTSAPHTALLSAAFNTTAGSVMTINNAGPTDNWNALAPGDAISCSACMSGAAYSGTIISASPSITSTGVVLSGSGGGGTYAVAPLPTATIASGTSMTFVHNVLGFNAALGYGAGITGSVTGSILTVNSLNFGMTSLAPTMVVSDGTHTGTLNACLTLCTQAVPTLSTWQLSNSTLVGSSAPMYVQAAGGAPIGAIPSTFMTPNGVVMGPAASQGTQTNIVKLGTFKVLVNGVVVCSDTTAVASFTWQLAAAPCTDAGSGVVNSANSWINYQFGTYSIAFNSAPALNTALITAQWVNCSTMNNDAAMNNVCWVGDGTNHQGVYSTMASLEGGMNAWITGQDIHSGGLSEILYEAKGNNYAFGTNFARLHNGQANQLLTAVGQSRWIGGATSYNAFVPQGYDYEIVLNDSVTPSLFNGSISAAAGSTTQYTAVLTLSGAATKGTLWEGELLDCYPSTLACASTSLAGGQGLPIFTEIVGLCNATYVTAGLCAAPSPAGWGASGSTYVIANTGSNTPFVNTSGGAFAIENALWYSQGPTAYLGPSNDAMMQFNVVPFFSSPEEVGGPFSSLKLGQRNGVQLAAAIAGNPSLGSAPTVTRTVVAGGGCDASAAAMPCFDTGNTFAAVATSTNVTGAVLTFNGLTTNSIPIRVGTVVSCSGCTAGHYVTSVSNPPTESTVAGAGQWGSANNGFTVTLDGAPGTAGNVHTFTFGCSGMSGVGSNCVNIGFDINTGGTYGGAAASLNTCGVNNIVGANNNQTGFTPPFMQTAGVNFPPPIGNCVPTGIGAFAWGFRIGSGAISDSINGPTVGTIFGTIGSSWPDGQDFGYHNGNILQNQAYTCNIVAAKVVQCVLAPQHNIPLHLTSTWGTSASDGLLTGIGQWPVGGTYVAYGDNMSSGYAGGMQGNAGGQSFPFTPGSGYTVPVAGNATSSSGFTTLGGQCPTLGVDQNSQVITMGVAISGGAITDVYPTNTGVGTFGACTFPLTYQVWGTLTGASSTTRTFTITSNPVTFSGNIPIGTGVTATVSGGAGAADLTIGSQILSPTPPGSISQPFPLIVTACPGSGCGTTGAYTVTNLNPGGCPTTTNPSGPCLSSSSWLTAITTATTPPAITGPIAPGQIISGASLPAGSYIGLSVQTNFTGFAGNGPAAPGTYTVVCPSACGANGSAQLFNVGLQSGSGGAITAVPFATNAGAGGIATIDSSNNVTGDLICDNSGAVSGNPLWGDFNFGYSNGLAAATNLTSPGLCAKPWGMRRGFGVAGLAAGATCSPGALQFNLACNGIFINNRRN